MIVRQFLQWIRTASAADRADATAALARAYLYSDLSPDDRAAAEGAMIMLLDDPSPMVRYALAGVLADSRDAPVSVILALAADQPEVSSHILSRSPLLLDADLVDAVGAGDGTAQQAIANRLDLSPAVAAAIAEVGSAEACLVLIDNPSALIAICSLDRIVERFGHLPMIRESLLPRPNLPASTRQVLVTQLSDTLARFCAIQNWLREDKAQKIARDACEKATIALAADAPGTDVRPLVAHLRQSGQLTAGLMLRALLSGNVLLFEETLAELSGLPISRVSGLVHDRSQRGLRAVFDRAGLPAVLYPAVSAAIDALREVGFDVGAKSKLRRRMTERVLVACEPLHGDAEMEPLLVMLRKFSLEAAREEARAFCDDLVAA